MSVLSWLASQRRAASRGYKRPMCEAGKKMRKKEQRGERDERKMRENEEEEGFRQRTEIKNQNGLHSIPCETSSKE